MAIPKGWLGWPRAYLQLPLRSFFDNPAHRSLLYYRLGLFLLLAVMAGKVLLRQHDFFMAHLTFYFTYALHLSLTYLTGVVMAELAVRWLCPGWSAYEQRTVARQWLIWGLGFGLGFLLYRLMAVHLVGLYAPWLLAFFKHKPHIRPSFLDRLVFCAAVWSAATFMVIQGALRWQKQLHRRQKAAARRQARPEPAPAAAPAAPSPSAVLSVVHDGQPLDIPHHRISHVTVEDHYCRIHYADHGGPRKVLVYMTLKNLVQELSSRDFVQIHRSHLVNLNQSCCLVRRNRRQYLGLTQAGAELPVSRHRWPELQKRLHPDGQQD